MICIVIPVFNRMNFTKACLDSLERQTYPADSIIVVDDGSTDGTGEMLRSKYPLVKVVLGDGNLFWTAAINMGIRVAIQIGADHILTLNNDTVASPAFIEKMMVHSKQHPRALIGALDLDFNTKRPYYGGEIYHWLSGSSHYLLNSLKVYEQNGLHEVSLFPGRGLLIPKIVFETIGLFAEKELPHYMADYDFTLLARKNGFKVYCNYDALLYTYPDEGGDHKIRTKKSLKNYFNHLFSIRGGGNLRNFTVYTFRNCPRRYIIPALFSGYLRRMGGYWLN